MNTQGYTDIPFNQYASHDSFIRAIKSAIQGAGKDQFVHDTVVNTVKLFNAVHRTKYGVTGKNSEHFIKYARKMYDI